MNIVLSDSDDDFIPTVAPPPRQPKPAPAKKKAERKSKSKKEKKVLMTSVLKVQLHFKKGLEKIDFEIPLKVAKDIIQ